MIWYRKIFLDKMKAFLLYFVAFNKDRLILAKNYLENCALGGSNKKLNIMIIPNKDTFLANNRQQKVWTLNNHSIFSFKDRRKEIVVSDFLFF